MGFKETFKRLILDSQQGKAPEILPRTYRFPVVKGKVVALTGPRRSGKTFLFGAMIQGLIRGGIERTNIVALNLEDSRLFGLTAQDLEALLVAYFELMPEKRDQETFLFLDEVQAVPGWEVFVRRILDNEQMQVFVTGSSASVSGRELSSTLRGRTLDFQVMPLSLAELGLFHGADFGDVVSSRAVTRWAHLQSQYMRHGGFPEIVPLPEPLKRRTLKDYLDLMLYRDIVDRFGVKNTALFKHVINTLIHNIGNLVSVNKLYNTLKSQGHALSRDTLYEYFAHLEEAMLFFFVSVKSESVRKQQVNPKKVYVLDPGFFWIASTRLTQDLGRVLENLVFLELKRRENVVMYLKGGQECDFLAVAEDGSRQVIQACFDLEGRTTQARETSALVAALETEGLEEAVIVTASEEGEMTVGGHAIRKVPFWKWVLKSRARSSEGYGYLPGHIPERVIRRV